MKKILFVAVFILISCLSFAVDRSYFIDEWECTTEDYRGHFEFYQDALMVYELDYEDPRAEILQWRLISDHVLEIEFNRYNLTVIDNNNFVLTPIDTVKEWMQGMEFKFKRITDSQKKLKQEVQLT